MTRFQPDTSVSLYDTLGGAERLEVVVGDFYDRIIADDRLSGFFAGTNMHRMKGKTTEFLSGVLGGPDLYSGLSMNHAHQGRGIAMEHFDLVAGHLRDSLTQADVPSATVADVLDVIAPLAGDIAKRI